MHGIGFWQRAVERGERDGLVQDPTLKCLKSIHTENQKGRKTEGGVVNACSKPERACVCVCVLQTELLSGSATVLQ